MKSLLQLQTSEVIKLPPDPPDPTHSSDVGRWLARAIYSRSGLCIVVDPRLDLASRCRLEQEEHILRMPQGLGFGAYQSASVRGMLVSLWGKEIYEPREIEDLDLTGKPWEPR